MTIDWEPFRKIIEQNERFVLTSHVRPDADALGSELALANMLESQGKQVMIVNPSATPSNLAFLDPTNRVRKISEVEAEDVLSNDVHVILDTSAWSQLPTIGDLLRKTEAQRVVIDHHVSSDDLNAIEFKDTTAEATGTLLHRLAMALDLPISKATAEAMFCAIATDTGWFRFPAIDGDTMRIAGDLMDRGVEPYVLYQTLYEQRSLARLHLASRILAAARVKFDGQLAFTTVTQNDFTATGGTPVDTEGMVNQCLAIAGTKAAFIAVELKNKRVKISFRSRPGINVSKVAERFGGGGHTQASGATMPGPLRVAVSRVLGGFKEVFEPDSEGEGEGEVAAAEEATE